VVLQWEVGSPALVLAKEKNKNKLKIKLKAGTSAHGAEEVQCIDFA
jgi:hypothetical protein